MNAHELNTVLRGLFKGLIDQGYKKLPMVEVTLGKTFSPQFSKFIEETNLGLIPLERMVNGLGYDLHLVPVKSDNQEFHKELNEQYQKFLDMARNDLVDYLDNRPTSSTRTRSTVFDEELDDILNELERDE